VLSSKTKVSDDILAEWRKAVIENSYLTTASWYQSLGEEKKQGVISVRESDDILRKLSLKSYEGGYKIMILWMPELLNIAAANKLLKIIEEPPSGTLFLLVANDHEQLLATILSRTQLVKFARLSETEIAMGLRDHIQISTEAADNISRLADGNFFEALQLSRGSRSEEPHFMQFRDWMRVCFRKDVKGAVYWADEIAGVGRERQKRLLTYGMHVFRECMMGNYVGDEELRMVGDERGFALKFAPFVKSTNLIELTEVFNEAHYHIERNANARILFLDLSFKVFRLLSR